MFTRLVPNAVTFRLLLFTVFLFYGFIRFFEDIRLAGIFLAIDTGYDPITGTGVHDALKRFNIKRHVRLIRFDGNGFLSEFHGISFK